ncbi:hypothetical protein ACFLU6_11265, partial [Acidobacteriota bacterium]
MANQDQDTKTEEKVETKPEAAPEAAPEAKTETKTATIEEIREVAEDKKVRKVLDDIFADLHPRLAEEKTNVADIFTPDSATDFLVRITDLEKLLSEEDDFEDTLKKFQNQIDSTEKIRDEALAELFEKIRPIETSYRQLWYFYDNSIVPDGKERKPVEFFIVNGDTKAMKDRESMILENIRKFVKSRNDNFNFRDDICNLVMPGEINMMVREALEEEAWKWGMLLITDLGDEKSYKDMKNQFRPGGKYEFLKRPDEKAASDVVMAGHLKIRDAHWFEQEEDEDTDLYAPASIIF